MEAMGQILIILTLVLGLLIVAVTGGQKVSEVDAWKASALYYCKEAGNCE